MKYYSLVLMGLLLLASCKSSKNSTSTVDDSPYTFNFAQYEKLSTVTDQAVAEGKLVFLDIYTDWCMPCKEMDKDVFTDRRLGEFFNENFVSAKVNAEKGSGPLIADLYRVPGYPTLLFLDQSGKVLVQKSGLAYQREMYELAEEALAIAKG